MKQIQLEDKEIEILKTLDQRGAMSPSQVSASTWMMPGETITALKSLSSAGLVLMRDDTKSPDGMVVAITQDAKTYLKLAGPEVKKGNL